ncbi:MAG TPA: TIGR01212 family radical SAM protein [Candidatus Limivivens intestinipullorum]|uniref:TIGR01212 family radical SAM protein n=1 Tax=Candidatus Limivivens intestinipullorum TaxID=2840858 RepID=A0A9D1JK05_9FIRM|nr:TIGR01212 family radical SAM protein [Candidatus Limivivens intestinipullorum]
MGQIPSWNGKPYRSLDYTLREKFGEKIYKVSLNGGMTCPNRDGTLGSRGCIFCSQGGSGDFAGDPSLGIHEQIEAQKRQLLRKFPARRFLAYFQAYTNTYAPVSYLRPLFEDALSHPDIAGLSVGTRPDCLPEDVLSLLDELNQKKPVSVELGLQTIHPSTAAFIRRGYPLSVFDDSVRRLRERQIEVVVHTILGLPGENLEAMLETIEYLNHADIQGIKLQLLHVLEGTDLADYYRKTGFPIMSEDQYVDTVIACLEHLSSEITVHRVTGDGPKALLIAPLWSCRKTAVLNHLHHEMKVRPAWQGRLCKKEVS